MSTKDERLAGLRKAMESELTGYHFYMNAADSTADPKGREAFLRLAQDEMYHFEYLRDQYRSLLEKDGYDFSKKLAHTDPKHLKGPIFSRDFKKRIKDSHFEVSALSIGMRLELDAVQYYRSCAENAKDKEAQAFFRELAEWENEHYEALSREMNILKEEYWQANNFIPM